MNMKILFAFLLALLSSPTLSNACRCMVPTVQSALTNADAVFRGNVTRALKTDDGLQKKYVVSVKRVFKGCAFEAPQRIVVTTSSSSASCGVTLQLNTIYAFSASSTPIDDATKKQLGKNTTVTQAVSIMTCNYNREWTSVPEEDKKALRAHNNQCPTKCKTGSDCKDKYYCDTGKCVADDAPCPVIIGACIADPCSNTQACPGATCITTYCGGCLPLWIDANRTRVCNQQPVI